MSTRHRNTHGLRSPPSNQTVHHHTCGWGPLPPLPPARALPARLRLGSNTMWHAHRDTSPSTRRTWLSWALRSFSRRRVEVGPVGVRRLLSKEPPYWEGGREAAEALDFTPAGVEEGGGGRGRGWIVAVGGLEVGGRGGPPKAVAHAEGPDHDVIAPAVAAAAWSSRRRHASTPQHPRPPPPLPATLCHPLVRPCRCRHLAHHSPLPAAASAGMEPGPLSLVQRSVARDHGSVIPGNGSQNKPRILSLN